MFIKHLANPLLLWNISNGVQSYYMILCPTLLLILVLGFITVTRTLKILMYWSNYFLIDV